MTCNTLDEVRANIDRIDDNIIKLIAERGLTYRRRQNSRKTRKASKTLRVWKKLYKKSEPRL